MIVTVILKEIFKWSLKSGFEKIQPMAYQVYPRSLLQAKQIKPFNKIAILLKDWTKIVTLKSARCVINKSKSKQKIVDFGFFDKTLCSYPLETLKHIVHRR